MQFCGVLSILNTLDLPEITIFICLDSQSAIRAVHKPKITSKLIRECIEALNEVTDLRPVYLTWVPGHIGIQGNEQADHLECS